MLPATSAAGAEDDPLLRAVMAAPMGPPLTEQERAAVEEAERSIAAGERGSSQEEIERAIEQMRVEQGDALDD